MINDGQNRKLLQEPDQIYNTNDKEYWWDTPILKFSRDNILIWQIYIKLMNV